MRTGATCRSDGRSEPGPGVIGASSTASAAATALRETYRAALSAFAEAADNEAIDGALLTAFLRLNAAYYLGEYLPADLHRRAVDEAARALGRLAGRSPSPRLSERSGSWRRQRREVLHLLGTRATDPTSLLVAQHALEVLPQLDAGRRAAVLSTAIRHIEAVPEDHRLAEGVRVARLEWLDRWAACNDRPPRAGETLGWARCVLRREPAAVLRQALASGLRFAALLDALTLAAALRALHAPGAEALRDLCAAHAVRRLCELSEAPRLDAWLGLATRLCASLGAAAVAAPAESRDPRVLADRAVRLGTDLAVQAAEAALVEAEALPREERDVVLGALAASCDTLAASTPHVCEQSQERTQGVSL